MKITRQKRPDRVICKWKEYEVSLYMTNYVLVEDCVGNAISFKKSEIPNLIKALLEIQKETK